MKQFILFISSCLVVSSLSAQQNRDKPIRLNKAATMEPASFPGSTSQKTIMSKRSNVATSPPYTKFSSAMNVFGFVGDEQNPLTYNADINCLALFQRHTEDWPNGVFTPAPGNGKSGYEVVKFTLNKGSSWDSVNYFQDDTYWARYPGGAIYNPGSNTDPGNAWFVGTGPATGAGSTWFANWFASAQIPTGMMPRTLTTNDQQVSLTNSAASFSDNTYFSAYSTTIGGPASSRVVYTGGRKLYTTPVATALSGIYGVAIFKGTFNGTNGFTWVQDSSFINLWTNAGTNADAGVPKIAFSPDGMTGYIVINGSDIQATLPAAKEFYQPMVWKTTDGGTTWNRVNQNYDWRAQHPQILTNLRPALAGNATSPAFFDNYGGGVTVDVNGKLHYVTALTPGFSTHPDSLGFGFLYPFSYEQNRCEEHPRVYDFTTDGNGTWIPYRIGDLYTAPLANTVANDSNAYMNLWTNGGDYVGYDNHIRVSRSHDGTKVFYTWTDGDTSNILSVYDGSTFLYDAYGPNIYPSLHYKGLDVNTGLFSDDYVNSGVNANSGGYWFYYAPDVVMNDASSYTIPCSYVDSRSGTYSGLTAVDVYHMDDNTIPASDFTHPAPNSCNFDPFPNGLVGHSSIKNISEVFPNPSNGSAFIRVNLEKAAPLTITVKDQLGRVLSEKSSMGTVGENQLNIEIANASAGIYFCTVSAGNSAIVRKLSVIK